MIKISNNFYRHQGVTLLDLRKQVEKAKIEGHAVLLGSNDGGPNHGLAQILATDVGEKPIARLDLSGETFDVYKVYSDTYIFEDPETQSGDCIRDYTDVLVDDFGYSRFHQILGIVKKPKKILDLSLLSIPFSKS